jgi:hypothetical protein
MAVVEFSWNYHSEYEIDGFAVSRIKIDRFRELDQSRVTFLDAGDPTMRKCSTLVEPGTPESFTIVQASEYEVAWYIRVGTRQKFTKDFQAVFLTPGRRVTEYAVRFDDVFELHKVRGSNDLCGPLTAQNMCRIRRT